jgi:hypothetical protein
MSDVQRFNDEVQRAGKDGFDAAVSSFGEANKGFQAIAAEAEADVAVMISSSKNGALHHAI